MSESAAPVIINMWQVEDGQQERLLDRLAELFERLRETTGAIEVHPVEVHLYESIDGTRVASLVKMPSETARQDAMEHPEVRRIMRELDSIAHSHMHAYRLVRSIPE
jgi:heme-degrading monooxygenase HmoA